MYNLRDYGNMIADTVRMNAYTEALQNAVRPGDIVIDIGTGTGIFALLALRLGASRVIAIEPNDCIQVARTLARENGLLDRIDFIQDVSTKVNLSEKGNVIVSDLRGSLPLYGRHIPAIVDARRRLLRPGGTLIPRRDTLFVCIVESPELYEDFSRPWEMKYSNLNLSYARRLALNHWSKGRVNPQQMLTQGQAWGSIDYHNVQSTDFSGLVHQRLIRNGLAHGLIIWFDADLVNGIGFSNSPECKDHPKVYGSVFFPFLQPVEVLENDTARIEIKAVLVNDEYTWGWNTMIISPEGAKKADFEQSTFYGTIFSTEKLRRRQPGYRPILNPEGRIELAIQQEMDGQNSLEMIAQKILDRFPDRFSTLQEAIERVADSSQKYGL